MAASGGGKVTPSRRKGEDGAASLVLYHIILYYIILYHIMLNNNMQVKRLSSESGALIRFEGVPASVALVAGNDTQVI
jgi:hypothetical protein